MVDQPSNGRQTPLIEQGDIYSLTPGGRKLLVISATAFNSMTGTQIVASFDDRIDHRTAGFSVALAEPGLSGTIRCDRIFSVRLAPPASKLGKAPKSIVTEVLHRLIAIFDSE